MILGITGPVCSGADTLGKILEEKGFVWISFSDILREELNKRGEEVTRDSLQKIGNELREKYGSGVLSERIIERVNKDKGKNYVVGNMRNPGEVERFRKVKDFFLIKIDAPQKLRFQRMLERKREKDPRTFSDFLELEKQENGKNQKEHGLHHFRVFDMADFVIINDSTLEELRKRIDSLLRFI